MASAPASSFRVPKGLDKIKELIVKFSRDPLYARFYDTLFALPSKAERERAAQEYLLQFLTRITVVDGHHNEFYQAFAAFRRRYHSEGKQIAPSDAKDAAMYIVCFAYGRHPERGFWSYSAEVALMWILDFFMAEVSPVRKLASISSLPNAYISCLFETDERKRAVQAPLRRHILARFLCTTSRDHSEWWMRSRVLASSTDLLLFSSDSAVIRLYEESISSAAIDLRSQEQQIRVVDKRGHGHMINLNSHQLVAATYLHTAYRLSQMKPEHLERVAARLGAGQELLFRVFPLVIDMLNGATLYPEQQRLLDLYEADDGELFRELANIAEDVRDALMMPTPPNKQQQHQTSRGGGYEDVLACYHRTDGLYKSMALYADIRHRIMVDKQLVRNTRWTYACTKEIPFCELFHALRHELQNVEQVRLACWLQSPNVKSRFEVNFQNVGMGVDLIEALNKREGDCNQNLAEAAEKLMEHMIDCNRTFAVLRFPEAVRYHEVSITLSYLCHTHPEKLRAKRSARWPEDGSSDMWESDSFFLGADPRGPYLVAFRQDLEILRQLQLLSALQSLCFHKTMPVFPLLVRFYFGNYVAVQSPSVSFVHQPKAEVRLSPEDSPDEPFSERAKTSADCDRHAVHVVAQTLAHWLRLPTEHSLLVNRSSAKDDTGNDRRFTQAGNKRRAEPPTAAAHGAAANASPHGGTYIPKFDENFFPCLRFMHRFADQLSRAGASSSFPCTLDYNALADFLELRRPRVVRRHLLEQMLAELERAHSRLPGDSSATVELLRAFLSRPVQAPHEEPPTAMKRTRLEETPAPSVNLCDAPVHPTETTTGRMMKSLSSADEVAMCNWLVLYAPVLNNWLSPTLVDALFRAPSTRVRIEGRRPISEDTFRDRLYTGSYDAPASTISEFLANYTSCFVTPASVSWHRLDSMFHEEPMQAFVDLMRSLEQLVSAERLGHSIGENMHSDAFDVNALFDESFCDARLPGKDPMRRVAREVIQTDGRSMLPIQAYGPHNRKSAEMPVEFAFYENSFCLILMSGNEFARFVGTSRAFDELRQENDYAPTQASRTEHGFGRMLDVALRFSSRLEALAYCPDTKWRSWNSFMEKRRDLGAVEPHDKIDRSKLFMEFGSAAEMFEFARKIWLENRRTEGSPAEEDRNRFSPALRALVELLRRYEIYKFGASGRPLPSRRKTALPPTASGKRPYDDLHLSRDYGDILAGIDQYGSFNSAQSGASFIANMLMADMVMAQDMDTAGGSGGGIA